MLAVQTDADGQPSLIDLPAPQPATDECLFHPKLLTLDGAAVGTLGDDSGGRFCVEPHVPCGACDLCAGGLPAHCRAPRDSGIRLAEQLAVPSASLVPIPDDVPDDLAILAGPVATALQAQRRLAAAPGDFVTVVGTGVLAALMTHLLHSENPATRLLSADADARRWAEQRGIRTRPPAEAEPLGDQAAVVATDATGAQLAIELARPRGTVVLTRSATPPPSGRVIEAELTLAGARHTSLAEALARLRPGGRLDLAGLTARPAPLRDVARLLRAALGTLPTPLLKP